MYTSQTRVEQYLDRELTENETLWIDDIIEHVSNFISAYTNRVWLSVADEEDDEVENEATPQLYDGNGSRTLNVPDFVALDSVEILDSQGNVALTFDQTTDWILTPANKNPKNCITLRNGFFPTGMSNIQITAIWGAGSVPVPVTVVATALTGKFLIKNSITASGKFKSESIEGYSYTLVDSRAVDDEINNLMSTLDMYKRIVL